MHIQAAGKAAFEIGKLAGWITWVGRHPGVILMGALAVAVLAVQDPPKIKDSSRDSSGEEVPLFI